MLFENAYIGLTVKALGRCRNKTTSKFFPEKGTKGEIIAIDDLNQTVLVKWKRGSTSGTDKWYTSCYNIEPYKKPDIRKIKKVDKNGNVIKVIEVDWNKLPCSKCERRYHFTCPKDCWNKKGEYEVY